MVLADTSIVIDLLRRPTPRDQALVRGSGAAVCGVTVAEVHAGDRTDQERARSETALRLFGRLSIPDEVWPVLGRISASLRSRGVVVPFPDALIVATALHHDVELWARDRHFRDMKKVIPELKLFKEPEEQKQ